MVDIYAVVYISHIEGARMKPPNKKLKETPKFANEDEEREFWLSHDTTEYLDWSKSNKISIPNLKTET